MKAVHIKEYGEIDNLNWGEVADLVLIEQKRMQTLEISDCLQTVDFVAAQIQGCESSQIFQESSILNLHSQYGEVFEVSETGERGEVRYVRFADGEALQCQQVGEGFKTMEPVLVHRERLQVLQVGQW